MRIYHPQVPFQGLPPENVFFVSDHVGTQKGTGYIIPFFQPEVFPTKPVNLYVEIDAPERYQYVLLGSLLARAQQLRDQTPQYSARLYSQVPVNDGVTLSFWQENGFAISDAEDLVRFSPKFIPGRLPMSCTLGGISLQNPYEQEAFVQRLNHYRISSLDIHFLGRLMQQPHFLPLAVYRNSEIIGEILLSGHGNQANVVALYVTPAYRRMGIGKTLLHRALTMLFDQGVTQCDALVLRRSEPQKAFAKSLHAAFVRTTCYYPGIDL